MSPLKDLTISNPRFFFKPKNDPFFLRITAIVIIREIRFRKKTFSKRGRLSARLTMRDITANDSDETAIRITAFRYFPSIGNDTITHRVIISISCISDTISLNFLVLNLVIYWRFLSYQ